MNRRKFINTMGVASAAPSFSLLASSSPNDNQLVDEQAAWIRENDKLIPNIVESQQNNSSIPFCGGFASSTGIFHVGTAAWNCTRLVCGLISKSSAYFEDGETEKSLNRAIEFVKRSQHTDGTIDLIATNFHSTPDTGFVVEPIAMALSCVKSKAPSRLLKFQKAATSFLMLAGKALRTGGIHTPNHRWVVCMALARINRLFPNRRLVDRIDQWFKEHVDIDPDGQYTEKSTSVYSPLVNRCLITIARLLEREDVFDPVRKNLEMTRFFVRPNGEIVTEVSRRQDQYSVRKMENYYYSYRYMAVRDQHRDFAAMANMIRDTSGLNRLVNTLPWSIEDTELLREMPKQGSLAVNYEKSFPHSGVVRIRKQNTDATILARNPATFTFHKKQVAIKALRLASAFFGKGQFIADSLKQTDKGYLLKQELQGPYYQPIAEARIAKDGDWSKMSPELRPKSEIQYLTSTILIRQRDQHFELQIKVEGTDHVPLAIELGLGSANEDRVLRGCAANKRINHSYLLDDSKLTIEMANEKLTVEFERVWDKSKPIKRLPTICQHQWTDIRGALPKLEGESVYITDYTPFEMRLKIY